ncbi:MAG: hypothetical protein V3V05_06375 [Pontiella sp.]
MEFQLIPRFSIGKIGNPVGMTGADPDKWQESGIGISADGVDENGESITSRRTTYRYSEAGW